MGAIRSVPVSVQVTCRTSKESFPLINISTLGYFYDKILLNSPYKFKKFLPCTDFAHAQIAQTVGQPYKSLNALNVH